MHYPGLTPVPKLTSNFNGFSVATVPRTVEDAPNGHNPPSKALILQESGAIMATKAFPQIAPSSQDVS
jgi:hypothetical protein